MLKSEPTAEAAESADDLVADKQSSVLTADGLDLRPVATGRSDRSAGTLHGFADKCRYVFRSDPQNPFLDGGGRPSSEAGGILAERLAELIGLHDVLNTRDRQPALRVHCFHAAEAGTGNGRPMVRIPATNEDSALRLTLQRPVVPYQAKHGVDRFGAGRTEKHVFQVVSEAPRNRRGEAHGRCARRLEERVVVGELEHLLVRGLRELFASIASIDTPEAGEPIKQSMAFRIVNRAALGSSDDSTTRELRVQLVVALRRQVVLNIELL